MRTIHNLTTILGALAVAWTLVLLSPGVRAVRAEDGVPSQVAADASEGATCEVDPVAHGQSVVDIMHLVQRAEVERLAASLKAYDPGPGYVDLDNRGFNQRRGK